MRWTRPGFRCRTELTTRSRHFISNGQENAMSNHSRHIFRTVVLLAFLAVLSSDASAQGITGNKQGQGGSAIQGAAGTQGSKGAKGLEHCDKPMGAVAVVEPQDQILTYLHSYNLQSPVGLIRMMIQQSNCFIVVERGVGMRNAMQERALAASGELRQNSNVGGGQMVTADFVLTPSVAFSENNAAGVGGAVSGLFGRHAAAVGSIAGGLKFKEAQTSMLLADARSTVQVAAAEGSTRKADMNLGAGLFGAGYGGSAGGYGNTNEGKIIAAAFLDNYNTIVSVVRGDPTLQRSVGSLTQEAAAGGQTKAGAASFIEGDVLVAKIGNVKLLSAPKDDASPVATLGRGEELVVIGAVENGFVNVQGANGSGWVKSILMSKQ
jgi:Curli production assembly/transport component CsgG